MLAGISEFPGILSRAPQTGHSGEQPSTEAYFGAGDHAGRAELILG